MDEKERNIEDRIEFIHNGDSAEASTPRKELSLRKGMVIIAILVLVLAAGGVLAYIAGSDSSRTGYGVDEPYIGVLHVEGTIGADSSDSSATYNQTWILDQIQTMKKDPNNEGILLNINSPGGSSYQTDEVYRAIRSYQKKTDRPVYAYFNEYAASGGYYIAASSDWIAANRNTITGSIGVYLGPVVDLSGLLDELGVNVEYIKAGENKAMGNRYTPLTEEQRQIYQTRVDELYGVFVQVVAEGRGMTEEAAAELADGRSYTASQAKENGLIDAVSTLSKTKKRMTESTGVDTFISLRYEQEQSLSSYFFSAVNSFRDYVSEYGKSEAEKTLDFVMENEEIGLYYLMQ